MKKSTIIIIAIVILILVMLSINAINTIKSTQTTEPSFDYQDDGIILMQHESEGSYGCFGCGTSVSGVALCIDPAPEMNPVPETLERYCNMEFKVIENNNILESPPEQKNHGGLFGKNCEGTKTKFDFSPVNLENTKVFLPLGLMTGSHVTPIDHHYFQNFDNNKPDIAVYSPGDGFVIKIEHMPNAPEGEDYRIVIDHTCTISSIYIHIDILTEKLFEEVGNKDHASVNIPVEAGELIGWYSTNVDYNLVDEEVTLEGFAIPEHYEGEPWKIHVPNTYEYFNEPVKSQLIDKTLRTVEPISGKIDYDIPGRIVGNWFLEGTKGYAGDGTQGRSYWEGHLAIAYDAYDPERIVFSIAGYGGEDSEQFAVIGNFPDPGDIGVGDGIIKYELVNYDWYTPEGNRWDRKSLVKSLTTKQENNVQGVALVEMLDSMTIKFETFPGKTASEVYGFTDNAKIYER